MSELPTTSRVNANCHRIGGCLGARCCCWTNSCDVRAAAAEIEAATPIAGEGEAGWLDIVTAPKDRRAILVWCPQNKCIYCVSWFDNRWSIFGGGSLIHTPTHWQSLPLPPSEPTNQQEHPQ